MANKSISVVSFFCGCGGFDLGFMGGFSYKGEVYPQLPFKVKAAYDFDSACVETYNQNIDEVAHQADLGKENIEAFPCAEVLVGGFPCQDFSLCGPLRGLGSERGRLYLAMKKYMHYHKPKFVIGENVYNLLSIHNGEVLSRILADFESEGYKFEVWKMPAKKFGVPQMRMRIIIMGVRSDIFEKNGMPKRPDENDNIRTIEWAIDDLKGISDETVPNQSQYFKAHRTPGPVIVQGDETSRRDQPAYTVRANSRSHVHFHYELPRRLTVRECARIQTFPDDFVFRHSLTTNMKQIGNAVPPLLAYRVGETLKDYIEAHNLEVYDV